MNRKFFVMLLLFFALLFSGCGSGSKAEPSQNQNEVTKPTNSVPVKATLESNVPTAIPVSISLELGVAQDIPDGGFSFQPIPGFEMTSFGGMVSMSAPGADADLGPVMQLMGWNNERDTTNEDLYEQLKRDTPMRISPAESITINGIAGLAADISGDNNGKAMLGRAAMIMVNARQQFVLMLGAPKDEWDAVAPYFEAVLASINFSELEMPVPTSNLSAGNYAFTNNNVVQDVIIDQNMAYAATLGGMVAWNLDSGYAMMYTPLQGMGHVSAGSITVCNIPDKRIIVGTLQGLSIYDPATGLWEESSFIPDESKVKTSKVTRLYCDQANKRLLIGYNGLGILNLDNGEFQHLTKAEGLTWDEVRDIAVASKDIWIANGYKGIAHISGNTITNYTLENGMPDERAQSIAVAPDGTVWVGASTGLLSLKNGKWSTYGSDVEAKLSDINEIEISSDGKIWLATGPLNGGRLCQFNLSNGKCESEYKDPDYKAILALDLNDQGLPLYGTSKGLYAFDGNNSNAMQTSEPLISNYVDSFAGGSDGKLWVGTDAGIQVLNPADPGAEQWTSYSKSLSPGMGGNWASAIATSNDGVTWAAIINGEASRYENGSWTSFKEIYSYNTVTVDADNRAWFGDDAKGIIVLNADGSSAMTFTGADGLPSDKVYSLLTDSAGTVWIGTDNGLAKYEQGKLTIVFGKDDSRLPNRYIRDLANTPDGSLLIGMSTGIARYDGNQVEVLLDVLKDGFPDLRLTTLAVSPSGQIWAGTDKGLLQADDLNNWSLLTTRDGLLTNYISALHADSFGALWVGGGGSNFDGGGILLIVP